MKKQQALALEWFQDLSDSNSFKERALGESRNIVLTQLKKLLRRRLTALDTRSNDFSDPSWAYKQAYDNGQRQVLTDLIKLLYFVEDKNDKSI